MAWSRRILEFHELAPCSPASAPPLMGAGERPLSEYERDRRADGLLDLGRGDLNLEQEDRS